LVAVLVTIDGVRFQEVFAGAEARRLPWNDARRDAGPDTIVPNLHRLATERGAAIGAPGHGVPIRAAGPAFLSLPGYHEIFTGRAPSTCRDNGCPPIGEPTLLDEIAETLRAPGAVAAIASWEGIGRAASSAPDRLLLSAGRSAATGALFGDPILRGIHAAGMRARPAPGHGEYRPDEFTAALGVAVLRRTRPSFVYLGLGDTDEYAHRGDYGRYLDALSFADRVVGQIESELAALERSGSSTVMVVTTDHGRGRDFASHQGDPASARVWLIAAGSMVRARGFVSHVGAAGLSDIAPTFRYAFGLPADRAPGAGNPMLSLLRPAAGRGARPSN
jgi:hypothetical protein